jgi:hypothetical protein
MLQIVRKGLLFTLLIPFLLATLGACTRNEAAADAAPTPRSYTLILTDTTAANGFTTLLVDWRKDRHFNAVLAVSGYPDETKLSLLQRLPWLLQPGVDTLYYDPALAGPELLLSLRDTLSILSPVTTVKLLEY